MTPRAQRTDPIYNRCLICGQVGHCSASCTQGRCNAGLNRPGSRSEAEAGGSELKPLLGEEKN